MASTPIQSFYSGRSIFITGGTGFVGAILVEKLLRSCGDLATIYMLARNKKGKKVQNRIDDLFENSVFERLRRENPKFRHRVVGVEGDCAVPELGMSLQDRQVLLNEVSVIFHVAATVRFDEKLKTAVAINVKGTKEVLKLASQMPNLKSLIHVSTAYSNVPSPVIEERFYPAPVDSDKLILLTDSLQDSFLERITPMILDQWPNTYTYTKAVAEDVVRREGQGLPVAVFRPSIVVSTLKEPIPAWINNLYGPTGVVAGAGSGILRTLHANAEVNANIVPVDMCVNAIIALAREISENFDKDKEIPVYHFESSNDQPLNWGSFRNLSLEYGVATPSSKAIWYYCFHFFKNYYFYLVATLFLHYLPALLVDGALVCVRKTPRMLKVYKKIHKFCGVISYFSTRSWCFKSCKINEMVDRMNEMDKNLFFCDLRQLNWHHFFQNYVKGIRIYLLQDPMETLEEARVKWRRLYWLHNCVKVLLFYGVVRLMWWFFSLFI